MSKEEAEEEPSMVLKRDKRVSKNRFSKRVRADSRWTETGQEGLAESLFGGIFIKIEVKSLVSIL